MKIKNFFNRFFWEDFWRSFSIWEKRLFKVAGLIFIVSAGYLFIRWYFNATEIVPKNGGSLREGYVGQPTGLNPVLMQNENDQSLNTLVFSGLLKSDGRGGVENDLAESIEKSEDGKKWIIKLRKDVFWHDGQKFTADDVIFTIWAIQNQDSRNPLRLSWQGIEIEKFNDYSLVFQLKSPFAFFEENLKQKIIPKHIFESVLPANFYLSDYNWQPVGTGPFIFEKSEKNKNGFFNSISFRVNENYYLNRPYLDRITIKFYKTEPEVISAFNKRQIDLISGISGRDLDSLERKFGEFKVELPRYYAVFFNQSISKCLTEKAVRYALSYSIDRSEIIGKVFQNRAGEVVGPILNGMEGFDQTFRFDFDLDKARSILAQAGWKDENGDGILEKTPDKKDKTKESLELSFRLSVPESAALIETASLLKGQWAKIGARVDVQVIPASGLSENVLQSRMYDALLFGNMLNHIPDPFSFWHSSQKFYPGLNLALYENQAADKILEEERQIADAEKRSENLKRLQALIFGDAPAVFLYNPDYLMVFHQDLKGITESKINIVSERYSKVNFWHFKTKRAFKK